MKEKPAQDCRKSGWKTAQLKKTVQSRNKTFKKQSKNEIMENSKNLQEYKKITRRTKSKKYMERLKTN